MATPVVLLDGGLGTSLTDQYACSFDDSTPLWSSHLLLSPEGRETLTKAQSAFASAGADVILSATYQASFEGFARTNIGKSEAKNHMKDAVQIAKNSLQSRHGKGKVALSLGAYGASMIPSTEYSGAYDSGHNTRETLRDWHSRRLDVFSSDATTWETIDVIAFETLPILKEVLAVRETMFNIDRPFWISCVFPRETFTLPDGSSVETLVSSLLSPKAGLDVPFAIGINCTRVNKVEALIGEFEAAVREMVKKGQVGEWPALVIYPDGTRGEVYNTVTKEWEKKTEADNMMPWDETMFDIVSQVRERGVWKAIYVGGCCKTTSEDIGKLRKRIDGL